MKLRAARALWRDVSDADALPPWLRMARSLWERFRADRLGLTASSLTFTTVLALVPFFAVVLSIFTAFPAFSAFEDALQQWLIESLIPEAIAGNVMGYLTQFASKASELGLAGFAGLTVTAVSLVLTIDRTLNQIWRVDRIRPLAQRILVYWAVLTLGPLVLGASLAISSYVLTASRGWIPHLPLGRGAVLGALQFALMTLGVTLLYRYVPNTAVRWRHAGAGALFVVIFTSLGRRLLGMYLAKVPTYSVIYGALATIPILLLWIYVGWLIVLFGAVIAAYLPSALSGTVHRRRRAGWRFRAAVDVLGELARCRSGRPGGLAVDELARRARILPLELTEIAGVLAKLHWIGRLEPAAGEQEGRYVLLVDPDATALQPLVDELLVAPAGALHAAWRERPLAQLSLADVTPARPPTDSQA